MTARRQYGVICKACNKPLRIGVVELEECAQDEDLRRTLVAEGWTGERLVTHSAPLLECTQVTQCRAGDAVLLD